MLKFYSLLLLSVVCIVFSPVNVTASVPQLIAEDTIVNQWDIFELSVADSTVYSNPFWDVTISAHFTAPDSRQYNVNGFYYDSAVWKIRFAPNAPGTWSYIVSYTGANGPVNFAGSFICTAPVNGNHGFIQVNPALPQTLMQSDSTVFIPLGIDGYTPAIGAAFLGISPQQTQLQVPEFWDTLAAYNINTIRLMLFHQPAFPNSFSWNPGEGNANLVYNTPALDQYDQTSLKLMDEWFNAAKAHHIGIYLCMMSIYDLPAYPFTSSPWSIANGGPYSQLNDMYHLTTGAGFTYEEKYFTYLANRWGAYSNLVSWEYNNEYGAICAVPWIQAIDSVINANDLYGHAHSVSFWNNTFSDTCAIDTTGAVNLTDDHFYAFNGFNVFNGDSGANSQAVFRYNTFAKPVMFGEFGSGAGSDSAIDFAFQRISYWGAFAGAGYPLYWLSGNNDSTGWAYDIATLQFLQVVNGVTNRVQNFNRMKPANSNITVSSPDSVRCYLLSGTTDHLVYLHHFTNHTSTVSGLGSTITIPGYISYNYNALWLNATTGDSITSASGSSVNGAITLTAPDFTVDELLLIKVSDIVSGITQVDNALGNLSLFPNPTSGQFTISLPEKQNNIAVIVYDMLGNKVYQSVLTGTQNTINLNNQPAGVYFVSVKYLNSVFTNKLVISK